MTTQPVAPVPTPAVLGKTSTAWVRLLLFLFTAAVACPIRYWSLADDFDNSWAFAINYAAAQGLSVGKDFVFNTGPLGYLVFPFDVGDNVSRALVFQSLVWLALAGILWELFFRSRLPTRNLSAFAVCFALSAPLFWFNRVGIENLLLAGCLISLVMAHLRAGVLRTLTALVLIGFMAMIKLTSAMIALGAVAGYLVNRAIQLRWKAVPEIILGLTVPLVTAGLICLFTLPSLDALRVFAKATSEITAGYSAAMSMAGPRLELLLAAITILLIGFLLTLQSATRRADALFLALLLAVPLVISLKHGFVRQDIHVINFFCFAAFAIGLIALLFDHNQFLWLLLALLVFGGMLQDRLHVHVGTRAALDMMTGVRGLRLLWHARDLSALHARLLREAEQRYRTELRLEPEVRAVIGDSPMSSLSFAFSGSVVLDHLRFVVYPLIQRAGAYTPYLDESSAAWVRTQGPQFLVFDGGTVDGRHAWTETPAMWAEIYRWYDTRLLGPRNLLLERRLKPRFQTLIAAERFPWALTEPLHFPSSQRAVFWKMTCEPRTSGKLRSLFFRMPVTTMEVLTTHGERKSFRVIPEMLVSPVLGSTMPTDLAQFATLFAADEQAGPTVESVSFSGSAVHLYQQACEVAYVYPDRNVP